MEPTAGEHCDKQSHGNNLTKKDISKIWKKAIEAFREMDSGSDSNIETPQWSKIRTKWRSKETTQ